jgi:hypothetical protein
MPWGWGRSKFQTELFSEVMERLNTAEKRFAGAESVLKASRALQTDYEAKAKFLEDKVAAEKARLAASGDEMDVMERKLSEMELKLDDVEIEKLRFAAEKQAIESEKAAAEFSAAEKALNAIREESKDAIAKQSAEAKSAAEARQASVKVISTDRKIPKVYMRGFIEKRGGSQGSWFQNWKTRFFVLDRNGLHYYSNETCAQDGSAPVGVIKLCKNMFRVREEYVDNENELGLHIFDPERPQPMTVKFFSAEDRAAWRNAVKLMEKEMFD